MVVLNESLQIIEKSMDENIVIRNRGGGCIIKHSPLFSPDGKYVYILCGWCVSAYSVQTGECAYRLETNSKENLVHFTIYDLHLLSVTSTGNVTIWKTNINAPEKTLKLELKDDLSVVELHPVASQTKNTDFDLVVVAQEHDEKELKLLLYTVGSKKNLLKLYVRAEDKPHSVSVCNDYVAAINRDRLTVAPFRSGVKKNSMLAGQGRWWTVTVFAPEGRGLGAGDNTGRILLWPQPLQSSSRAIYHWHSLPVTAITFSPTGSYMYSGGGEGVMVRWNVEVSNVRNFLPRLPAPIAHLRVSPDNQYVAIATQDNGIQLVDAQNRVTAVIQRLSFGVQPTAGTPLFPAGLVWDPRSRSIVLNGRPGHLQFFNTDGNKLLYNLDITGQNYLSQERHKVVINAEVTQIAISHDGKWLVTVETRDDCDTFLETLLKFWQYKFNARQFSLNTCIQLPHQGRVNVIKFQPPGNLPDNYLLVTTGTDNKFRVWVPSFSESIHSEGLRWVCDSVGYYRSMPAGCVSFSADGSVLGVTFGASLTLWDVEISQLKTSLTWDNSLLKGVEFGSSECCHLVVTASESHIMVWNILTLSMQWCVPLQTALLCADPLSSYMAVFTTDNSLYIFTPSNSKPIYEKKNVCAPGNNVLAAIFVPRTHTILDTRSFWCSSSQLHFIDSNQELRYLELESEQDIEESVSQPFKREMPVTPFSILAAQQSSSTVVKVEGVNHTQFGTAGDAAVRKLVTFPASTMPHIYLFCNKFLKSMALTRKSKEETRDTEESEREIKVDDDSDSTVINEECKVVIPTKKQKKKNKKERLNSEGSELGQSPNKEIKEVPSKKKQRRKQNKEKSKSPLKKENKFSFDDLDTDWLSVFEDR